MRQLNFIDLFAGAGGLSEGFIRAGFNALAHVEMDTNACDTIRTRIAFHYLTKKDCIRGGKKHYESYLKQEISREELYKEVPEYLFETVINKEISDETIPAIFKKIDEIKSIHKVDLIIGGPPCQAYSLIGRARDPKGMVDDKRNYLFKHYAKFLQKYEPQYFVFENVLGLLSAGNKAYFNEMQSLFREIGYAADFRILNSEDFGVVQKRRRVVIIGKRSSEEKFNFTWPKKIENTFEIMKDVFADLPPLKPGDSPTFSTYKSQSTQYLNDFGIRNGFSGVSQHITRGHNSRDLEIYRIAIDKMLNNGTRLRYDELSPELQTHNNTKSFLDRFKVVDPKGKSHTMVAHISKDGHHYIYPDLNQVRSLSVREAARIQSFPDDYFFEGGRTAAFRQIGNAVPPLMGEMIARAISVATNQ